ncbi:tRNA lysidine(34) synthetase TilS [bacterium]|nr:tRNA lysidine(34) synthetase TilS [bacterium]
MFLNTLAQTAAKTCKLDKDKLLLVGVSGGADSLALMHGLHALGYRLLVAHLDHGLRPKSAEDAIYVQRAAADLGLAFVSDRIEVADVAETQGLSLEEAARQERYHFLFEQARKSGAQAVAVAHQADDQVETVLMHLLRGAALPGLSGMDYCSILPIWDKTIPLVRPMLDLWRKDVEIYLAEVGLEPREDHTNQDTTYFRNSLRHELIPDLEGYNPRFKTVLWRMADVLREEDGFLETLADQAWANCFRSKSEGTVQLDTKSFTALAVALRRRVLRRAVGLLRPDLRDVGFEAVERALAFIAEPKPGGEVDLAARLTLAVINEQIVIKIRAADWPDFKQPLLPFEDVAFSLEPKKPVLLSHGWQLMARVLDPAPTDAVSKATELPARETWLDADRVRWPLSVRSWRSGEKWRPLGLDGHSQKLSDFFINEKIPQHLRAVWPLVCDAEGQVLWVAGLRPAEDARVRDETKWVLHLSLVRKIA